MTPATPMIAEFAMASQKKAQRSLVPSAGESAGDAVDVPGYAV